MRLWIGASLLLVVGCGDGDEGEPLPPGTRTLPETQIPAPQPEGEEESADAEPDAANTPDTPDEDGDGYGPDEDCDDRDNRVSPAADDLCDGVDNDCNGLIDDAEDCPCDVRQRGDHAYLFCNRMASSWMSARSHCTQYGYDLLAVEDEEEMDWVIDQAEDFHTPFVWTGLNDRSEEDQWAWSNGESADYSPWNEGEPNNWSDNEDCGIVYVTTAKQGRFNDRRCSDTTPQHICETP